MTMNVVAGMTESHAPCRDDDWSIASRYEGFFVFTVEHRTSNGSLTAEPPLCKLGR